MSRHTGTPIAASTIRPFLAEAGLSRPEGRPPGTRIGKAPEVEPLGSAGAELSYPKRFYPLASQTGSNFEDCGSASNGGPPASEWENSWDVKR